MRKVWWKDEWFFNETRHKCYTSNSVVCLSAVCHTSELRKNGWTDRDAVWVVNSNGLKEPWRYLNYSGTILSFSPRRGGTLHWSILGEIWGWLVDWSRQISPQLVHGWGVGLKTENLTKVWNINAPRRGVSLARFLRSFPGLRPID